MPYSADHKARTREKILASAAALFSHHGYEKVSIDRLMNHAGLTRGAFYNHFADKPSVYEEALGYAARKSYARRLQEQGKGSDQALPDVLRAYLSRAHIEDDALRCPLAFLATDVAQRQPQVRSTYTRVFSRMVRRVRRLLGAGKAAESPPREEVLAVTAMMIGGVAIANALDDEALGDELMQACREAAERLLQTEK